MGRRGDWEPVDQMLARLSIPEPNTGCHIWQGKIGTGGYAYISYRGETGKRLHRKAATVALELSGRPRPEGLEVSHTCNNRSCVNPDHLIWETHIENLIRREWSPKGQRYIINCKHCGKPKTIIGKEWGCAPCAARRAKEWRERTEYNFSKYRAENKGRINAQRRIRRGGQA